MTQAENEFYRSLPDDWYADEDNQRKAVAQHIDAMESGEIGEYFLEGWAPSDASEVRSETMAEGFLWDNNKDPHTRVNWPEEDEEWTEKLETWVEAHAHEYAIRWWDDEPCEHKNRSISEPDLCQDCERHVGDVE